MEPKDDPDTEKKDGGLAEVIFKISLPENFLLTDDDFQQSTDPNTQKKDGMLGLAEVPDPSNMLTGECTTD
jgi:hypothetical protein